MARSFDLITRYIPLFSEEEDIGEWIFDKENDGSMAGVRKTVLAK